MENQQFSSISSNSVSVAPQSSIVPAPDWSILGYHYNHNQNVQFQSNSEKVHMDLVELSNYIQNQNQRLNYDNVGAGENSETGITPVTATAGSANALQPSFVLAVSSLDQLTGLSTKSCNGAETDKVAVATNSNANAKMCPICKKSFSALTSLRRHQATHNTQRELHKCDICNKSYTEESTLVTHKNLCHGEFRSYYECELCQRKFGLKTGWRRHVKVVHPDFPEMEPPQQQRMEREQFLAMYNKKTLAKDFPTPNQVQPGDPQECPTCKRMFRYPYQVKRHLLSHGDARPFKCQYCSKTFRSQGSLTVHIERHLNIKKFKSRFCEHKFKFRDSLRRHEKLHEKQGICKLYPTKTFPCTKCSEKSPTSFLAQQHFLDKHGPVRPKDDKQCQICLEYVAKSEFNDHFYVKHQKPANIRIQRILFKPMVRYVNRGISIVKPSSDTFNKPWFLCAKCGRTYSSSSDAKHHKLTCPNRDKYRLSGISTFEVRQKKRRKQYSSRPQLSPNDEDVATSSAEIGHNHISTSGITKVVLRKQDHSRPIMFNVLLPGHDIADGPWRESWTDDIIERKGCDPRISRIPDEKPQCLVCQKYFANVDKAYKHLVRHETKKFACEICGKSYFYRTQLKGHMRVHTGEKPYPCRVCGKAFRLLEIRYVHEKAHDQSKKKPQNYLKKPSDPVMCDQCSNCYPSMANLRLHKKFMHPDDGIKPKRPKPFGCAICKKLFASTSCIKHHVRAIHKTALPEVLLTTDSAEVVDADGNVVKINIHDYITRASARPVEETDRSILTSQ